MKLRHCYIRYTLSVMYFRLSNGTKCMKNVKYWYTYEYVKIHICMYFITLQRTNEDPLIAK